MGSPLTHTTHLHQVSCNLANKQADRGENITSLAEVNKLCDVRVELVFSLNHHT